jgi:2-oxoglutarate dehydrogenase E1 component
MDELQKGQKLRYTGRQASASPAAGQMKVHQAEQKRLIEEALG